MKKSVFKLMSAAVALSALASCSDDLGLSSSAISSKADMVAKLVTDDDGFKQTRMGMYEVEGDNPWSSKGAAGWKWVYTEGDILRVFTMQSMLYNTYELVAGENTDLGEFNVSANAHELPEGYTKYAISDAQFAYGVSPEPDGTPRLTYTIPYKYQANTYDAESVTKDDGKTYAANVQKLPAPFWGVATEEDIEGAEGKILNTSLDPLTAFLRINTETLPEGTKYIVLTTHGSARLTADGGRADDGFQLLAPDPSNPANVKVVDPTTGAFTSKRYVDNLAFWDENATKFTDGNSEPISGTFNALLVDKKSKLAADEGSEATGGISRLVTRDELVIEVGDATVFWIPIIAQKYNNLHVLAVTKMSENYIYKYVGTELKKYHNWDVEVAKRFHLDLNLLNLGKVCAHDLNAAIAEVNKANKFKLAAQNIINVDTLANCTHSVFVGDDHDCGDKTRGSAPLTQYPNDQILVQGEGNLVINIATIDVTTGAKGNLIAPVLNNVGVVNNTLFVSDKNYANSSVSFTQDYATAAKVTTNSVKINVPADWAAEAERYGILADLPKTNVIFAANKNYLDAPQQAAKNLRIDVHGSATEFVNGKEVYGKDSDGNIILKEGSDAAINVVSGFGQVNVLAQTKGDVYIDGTASKQKVELTQGLFIYTDAGLNVRMDNALAKNVGFLRSSNNHENYLITIGSSAIQKVGVAGILGSGAVVTGQNNASDPIPNDLTLLAYWTGYALDASAVDIKDYDNGTVYTAAQLASMGEKIDGSTTAQYKVNKLLEYIWLGGKNYGWVGPKVTVDNFKFDGNGVSLLNMYMPQNEKEAIATGTTRPIYVYDPHICCTTCGWNSNTNGSDTELGAAAIPMNEFGLIRSIKNAGEADSIINVNLNDVYANGSIGYVGSLVGVFNATTKHHLKLDNNYVGEVRLELTGDDIGGLIGLVNNVDTLAIDHNRVGNSQYGTGYIKGKHYVGGAIGRVRVFADTETGALEITDTDIALAGNIEASASDAAGLVGHATTPANTLSDVSVATKNIKAGDNHAAGVVAYLEGKDAKVYDVRVDVAESIEAGKQFAAGLIAWDGITNRLDVEASDIKAGTIKAEDGYVGGEVAYAPGGTVTFGITNDNTTIFVWATERNGKNLLNKVEVGTLAGAYNVGGFVGNNANNADVYFGGYVRSNSSDGNSVIITKFENTKDDLDSYFVPTGSEANSHLAGTMSNVVGRVDGNLYINETCLTVVDNLNGDMKKAVGYTYRNDQGPTPGLADRLFWGDYNGYVGWGKSGNYFIDDDVDDMGNLHNKVVGDQATGINGFNLYKLEADYNTLSKNAPAE